jgi:membrane protein YdbS with pleckstrin-like domain
MAYPEHLLARGEQVVLHKHPHWKVLVLPAIAFIIAIGGGAAFIAWVTNWQNSGFQTHAPWIIGTVIVAVLLLIFFVLVPFLRWSTEHFVISTGHVFFRTGILRRREHQIPLARIQNMETEVGFWGRVLGYGTLIVESAADQPLAFDNVASLPKVQATLNQLISDDRRSAPNESTAGDGSAGRFGPDAPGAQPRSAGRRPEGVVPARGHDRTEFDQGRYDDGGSDGYDGETEVLPDDDRRRPR